MKRKRVHGLEKVLKNLNKQIGKIPGRTTKGLIRAGIIIRRATENESPVTPVDWGNLRASFFTVTNKGSTTEGKTPSFEGPESSKLSADHEQAISNARGKIQGSEPGIILGYSAYYAWYVHEQVGATYQREGAGSKFFESSLKSKEKEILDVIRKEARIR